MLKLKVKLKLYSGRFKRKSPFKSGYRPLFDVYDGALISGKITLLDREAFYPGDEGDVEITFANVSACDSKKLYFYEGKECFGECEIISEAVM